MTCLTCGAALERIDTSCPVCAAPVATDAGSAAPTGAGWPAPIPPGIDASPGSDEPRSDEHREAANVGAASSRGDAGTPRAELPTGPGIGGSGPAGGPADGPAGGGWQRPAEHPSGLSSEARGWGIAAHLIGLGGALLTVVTLGFLGPLLVWLLKRDDHPFIEHHAKESLNFQLTTLVALVVGLLAAIPVFLLGFLTLGVLWLVALAAVLAATVVWFVFPIIGAVKAANGEGYRYPINIRFVR